MLVFVRILITPPAALSLLSIVACAMGCGLDAAYAAFTTSTTGTGSTGEPGSTESTGGHEGTDTSSGEGSAGMSGSTGENEASTGTTGGSTGTTGAPDPFCGDGMRDPGEECDPLEPGVAGKSCNEQCFRDRLVFVTSERYIGDKIEGIIKADQACNKLAEAAGVYAEGKAVEPMRAWLSASQYDAGTRVLFGEGRYVRPDGEVVVDGLDELFSGHLRVPISIDEMGNEINGTVWTNTRPDGTAVSKTDTCNNWSYNNQYVYSYVGGTPWTDLNWTFKNLEEPALCDFDAHLYCFEERGAP
jgi:hypothetical protein